MSVARTMHGTSSRDAGAREHLAARLLVGSWLVPLLLVLFGGGRVLAEAIRPHWREFNREAQLTRWNGLTPEEQVRLRERYVRYQTLSESHRSDLLVKAERLERLARQTYIALPEAERARIDQLLPEKKREILREMATDEALRMGEAALRRIAPELRARFEAAPRERQQRFLRHLKEKQAKELGKALDTLARELALGAGARAQMAELPLERRRMKLLELLKRRLEKRVEESGLPLGVTSMHWRRLAKMEPEDFFQSMQRLRRVHPELWPQPDESSEGGDEDRSRRELGRRLREALHSADDRVSLSHLSSKERRAEIGRRRRERVIEIVIEEDLLGPKQIKRLREFERDEFRAVVHRLASGAAREGRGGKGGGREREERGRGRGGQDERPGPGSRRGPGQGGGMDGPARRQPPPRVDDGERAGEGSDGLESRRSG